MVDRERKRELLSHLITTGRIDQALVFTRTKHGANRLAQQLDKDGIAATAIHGNKSQPQRVRALADFKAGRFAILVATEVAARGLDIEALPHVVNFELPMVPEDYVHRIGRTGRAGVDGDAVSLVCVDELKLLNDIERVLGRGIPRETIPGFEPDPRIRPEPILRGGLGGARPSRVDERDRGATPRRRASSRRRRPGSAGRSAATGRSSANGRRSADGRVGPVRRRSATVGGACASAGGRRTSLRWLASREPWRRLRRSATTGAGDRQRRGTATPEPGSDPAGPAAAAGRSSLGRAPARHGDAAASASHRLMRRVRPAEPPHRERPSERSSRAEGRFAVYRAWALERCRAEGRDGLSPVGEPS